MGTHKPGELVLQSGVYRVHHDAHRLMHEVTLRINDIFPCCRQCGGEVRFELARPVKNQVVLGFRSGEILEECEAMVKAHKQGY